MELTKDTSYNIVYSAPIYTDMRYGEGAHRNVKLCTEIPC
jgi:hypothetical protein